MGLKDDIEYIVYNNKKNYNIDIMRINDKIIINLINLLQIIIVEEVIYVILMFILD